jgi:hypothetical protein
MVAGCTRGSGVQQGLRHARSQPSVGPGHNCDFIFHRDCLLIDTEVGQLLVEERMGPQVGLEPAWKRQTKDLAEHGWQS